MSTIAEESQILDGFYGCLPKLKVPHNRIAKISDFQMQKHEESYVENCGVISSHHDWTLDVCRSNATHQKKENSWELSIHEFALSKL